MKEILATNDNNLGEVVEHYQKIVRRFDKYEVSNKCIKEVYDKIDEYDVLRDIRYIYNNIISKRLPHIFMLLCYESEYSFDDFLHEYVRKTKMKSSEYIRFIKDLSKDFLEELENKRHDIKGIFTEVDMRFYILCNSLFKFYNGFVSESVLMDFTERIAGLYLIKDKKWDSDFSFDFCWSNNKNGFDKIVAQEKSISLLPQVGDCKEKVENKINLLNKYYNKNKLGINKVGGVKGLIYIFHDEGDITPLFWVEIDWRSGKYIKHEMHELEGYLMEKLNIKRN